MPRPRTCTDRRSRSLRKRGQGQRARPSLTTITNDM